MNLLYPRCCVLDVKQQQVEACLRLQDVDSPAHKEVRTFGIIASDVVVLSDWLADHGVTHVAIEHSAGSWKPLYLALHQAFTVVLINPALVTDAKDIQWIADLLAYGLVRGQVVSPSALREMPHRSRRTRLAVVAALFIMVMPVYGVWRTGNRVDPEPPSVSLPPPSVHWQQLQVDYHHPAGEPLTLPLPTLERTPEGVPVEVMLETPGARANWLQLDRERLQLQGTAPITAAGQTYQLVVRAQPEHGGESRLQLNLTITDQPQLPPSATDAASPAALDSPQPLRPDPPSDRASVKRILQSW